MRRIAILGSTGSIGTQTLDIVRANGDISVTGISARQNISMLERQIREFSPVLCAVWDKKKAADLAVRVADTPTRIVCGMEGLLELSAMDGYEILVTGIEGMIGIRPTVAAIKAGKDIALANKETLVAAGHIIIPLARESHVRLLPVDSEQCAIFQCLNGEAGNKIERILLTASGGPFRGYTKERLERVSLADALKNPNWSMGKKVTIDSATLVNKGLEVMEAGWLFDVPVEDITVVVQPQSVVHSMVCFNDGAVIAQLSAPDMRLAIQYALYYPERRPFAGERLDFWKLGGIAFEKPDFDVFPGLKLAYRAAMEGGSLPVVYNAANEQAVAEFLDGKIRFAQIPELIEAAMDHHARTAAPSLEEIFMIEAATKEYVAGLR